MKLAKESGVIVLLDGQGGDELLAGYDYYFIEYLLQLVKFKQFNRLIQELHLIHRQQIININTINRLFKEFGHYICLGILGV